MRFLALATLLALTAFFAAGEFALIRLRPSRVRQLEEAEEPGPPRWPGCSNVCADCWWLPSSGAVLALVAAGWIGRGLADQLGRWLGGALSPVVVELLVFSLLVLVATLVGGLLPKAWVLHQPEASALRVAPLLESLMRILSPLLVAVERFSGVVLRLAGLPRNWDHLVPVLSAGRAGDPD